MTEKSIDYDNNLRSGADKGGRGGLRGIHVVPLPSPVPPSPLEPSAVQGVGSPSGGGVHRGGDLPLSSSTPVVSTSTSVDSTSTSMDSTSTSVGSTSTPVGSTSTSVGSTSTLVDPTLPPRALLLGPCSPGKPSLPPDVNPLPGCSDPDFCVGGLDHLSFRAPGGLDPTRDQIVWVTRR